MRPTLFVLNGTPVPSYSVFMVLGFIAALATIMLIVPKGSDQAPGGLDRPQAWDVFLVMVVSAVFGSKWGHVLFEAPGHVTADGRPINSIAELLADDPWHWLRIGEAGYVWYGGMLACLGVAAFYFWRRPHLNAWLFADTFAPAVMIGAMLGRTGCFLSGCCYGRPTESFLGVQFPHLPGPVYPTQIYDALIAAALGALLLYRFPRRRFDGENIALLLITYPMFRSLTEAFRGDPERGGFGPLSTSQWISIPLLLLGVALYVVLQRRGQVTVLSRSASDESSPGVAPSSSQA
ncbi:MAG: prolipoprotein diacylglyceryl transferase [Myxococcota bacterium]